MAIERAVAPKLLLILAAALPAKCAAAMERQTSDASVSARASRAAAPHVGKRQAQDGPLDAGFFDDGDGDNGEVQRAENRPFVNVEDGTVYQHPWMPADGSGLPELDSHISLRLGTWREQAVNTSLVCGEPGCQATTQLQAFDGSSEIGRGCRLSLDLHPTDFDDQYSGERLEFVRVNGVTVNTDCFPMRGGCNESTQKYTFPCLMDFLLEDIIDATGLLEVTAKIPTVVDECPYQGNYLAAVPKVTCLVTQKPTPPPPPPPPPALATAAVQMPTHVVHQVKLRCPARGCEATASLSTTASEAIFYPTSLTTFPSQYNFSKCLLAVRLYQTDFDQSDGTEEIVEYVRVGGVTAASNLAPGKNPCRSEWAGTPLPKASMLYSAIEDFDVTANVTADTPLLVQAKISPHVDECGYEGYLLNGVAALNCTIAPAGGAGGAAAGAAAAALLERGAGRGIKGARQSATPLAPSPPPRRQWAQRTAVLAGVRALRLRRGNADHFSA